MHSGIWASGEYRVLLVPNLHLTEVSFCPDVQGLRVVLDMHCKPRIVVYFRAVSPREDTEVTAGAFSPKRRLIFLDVCSQLGVISARPVSRRRCPVGEKMRNR